MHKRPLFFSVLLLSSTALADTAVLQSAADASISSKNPDNNFGGDGQASAGRDGSLGGNPRRALFRFDLSTIPAGSTINSAVLKLTVVKTPGFGAVNSSFKLHRLTAGWIEGTKTGNNGLPAATGEVTWNSRAHGITAWTGGPGASGDFAATPSASTAVTGNGGYAWSSAQLAADVQGWLANPAQSFGWILISDNEAANRTARAFGSRENITPANRPVLELDYTPPAPPPNITISSLAVNSNGVELAWTGPTNLLYAVEYATDPTVSNGWKTAEAYLEASTVSNVWNETPLFAGPQMNSSTLYRIQGLETNLQPLEVQLDVVASGLTAPVMATHAGDGSGRLFVVEQVGRIRIIDASDTLLPTPFLDISSLMTHLSPIGIGGVTTPGITPVYDERGLLGLAFHPDYASNGRFFIRYNAPATGGGFNNKTVIAEYAVSGGSSNVADSAAVQTILEVDQPQFNHDGGTIAFGPDGFLYIGFGDGGGANDDHGSIGNGQNTANLLGTIVRIDVDTASPYAVPADNPFVGNAAFLPEIYAYGFRNPYRFSFDSGGSGGLYVADVGQNLWEEIDRVEAGENHGWRIAEGNFAFDLPTAGTAGVDLATLSWPIHNYKHGPLGISVIGGFVYRGTAWPGLTGKYLFGDFSTSFGTADGQLYYLSETLPGKWQRFEFSIQPGGGPLGRYVKGFGRGEDGEIYLLSDTFAGPSGSGGDVRRLVKPGP